MPTDEYEISLMREVAVCRGHVAALRREIREIEMMHGLTPGAGEGSSSRRAPDPDESIAARAWREASRRLAEWEARQEQYEEVCRRLRSPRL